MAIIPIDQLETQSTSKIIPIDQMENQGSDNATTDTRKSFYDAIGANMTPEEKANHPILAGIHQTAQDVGTLAEKTVNGLTLGGADWVLNKAGIKPPDFENTAPENKSGLNLMGDVSGMTAGGEALGALGSKIIAPAAKAVAKAVPEGLKQSSYALMQSIVNQLPKEFKYGANAGRAMVREKFSGDAADIKEQAQQRIDEIKGQGDALASASTKTVNNSNAIKVIDDKISQLKADSPESSDATITKLEKARRDLLGAVRDEEGDVVGYKTNPKNMTAKETLDFKRKFDDHTAWKGTASDDTVFNKTMQQARTAVKDNLNDAVPEMKVWNERYADLSAARQAAARTAASDQAGAGIKNALNGFVRGSIGLSSFGALISGNGKLAGEILLGGLGKEIITNPYLKSKFAQALYNVSEADLAAMTKVVPWVKKVMRDASAGPKYEKVDAELVNPGMPTKGPTALPAPAGAPRLQAPKTNALGYDAESVARGEMLDKMKQNYDSKPIVMPNGVNRLPSPTSVNAGPEIAPTIAMPIKGEYGSNVPIRIPPKDVSQLYVPSETSGPKYGTPTATNPDAGQNAKNLYLQKLTMEEVPFHPTKEAKVEIGRVFSPKATENIARSVGIKPEKVESLKNISDYFDNVEPGGRQFKSTDKTTGESTFWGNKSSYPKFVQAYGPKNTKDLINKVLDGKQPTSFQKAFLKKLLNYYEGSL